MSDIYSLFGKNRGRGTQGRGNGRGRGGSRGRGRGNGRPITTNSHMEQKDQDVFRQIGMTIRDEDLPKKRRNDGRDQNKSSHKRQKNASNTEDKRPPKRSFAFNRSLYATIVSVGNGAANGDKPAVDYSQTKWSMEQQEVIDRARNGDNVFFSGAAGCGKTHLEGFLKQDFHQRLKVIAVLAPTGLAAFLSQGQTIHNFIGLPQRDHVRGHEYMLHRTRMIKKLVEKWQSIDVMMIDEISMVDAHLFSLLDYLARHIRNEPKRPMGGIQVIACGDFYQLPPVRVNRTEMDQYEPLYAFESPAWPLVFPVSNCVTLSTTYRQTDDQFVTMLNELRRGVVSKKTSELLRGIIHANEEKKSRNCLKLLCTVADVRAANEAQLQILIRKSEIKHTYQVQWECFENDVAQIWAERRLELVKRRATQEQMRKAQQELYLRPPMEIRYQQMQNEAQWLPEITLAVGARVMLCVNIDPANGLMNAACGQVVGFQEVIITLAGQPMEVVNVDEENTNKNEKNIEQQHESKVACPLVKFDRTQSTVLVKPYPWYSECREGTLVCWQLPLRYAWASTIHKCQGQTLDEAEIDLQRVFERGQAYVALSRVRTIEGVHFSSYSPDAFKVDARVEEFYDNINYQLQAWKVVEPYIIPPLFGIICEYWMGRVDKLST